MVINNNICTTEDSLFYSFPNKLVSSKDLCYLADVLKKESKEFLFLSLSDGSIEITDLEILRLQNVLKDSASSIVYSDFRIIDIDSKIIEQECIDYQVGSVRDDFDFGHLAVINAADALAAIEELQCEPQYQFACWYQLRLALSLKALPYHLNEYLYTYVEKAKNTESQFDYVNPRNRNVQIEFEQVFTSFLKKYGAWTDYSTMKSATALDSNSKVVASVVIPVYNRVKTIKDAVTSALSQECSFPFNIIVVDNHSTDGTTEVLNEIEASDSRLIHIIPEELSLKIGGCWNKAVNSESCGDYIVQLDSDDIYSGKDTLQKMVNAFSEQDCMAVVGSYRLTDFNLNELPPGVIDHKEWTPENGMNNALRINGLGAPRGFRRDLLRNHPLPNTSYGEDYAAMLRICREYRIGRIYESLYDCRRWSGNSDAALSREKINRNNLYKDRIRSIEIIARKNR